MLSMGEDPLGLEGGADHDVGHVVRQVQLPE
jgi:hypothetical protein